MKKWIILLLSFQLSSCSSANEYNNNLKTTQNEAEISTGTVISLLPDNLNIIFKIDSNTSKDLKDSIFNHVLFQVALLKGLEESGKNGFSVNDQLTYRPHISNTFCLINKFLLTYKEKHPSAVSAADTSTFDWINTKQTVILKSLEKKKLPQSTQHECKTYSFYELIK